MTRNQVLWLTNVTAYGTNLIFEPQTKWIAKSEVHFFGQTAYIVVAFDGCACN